MKYQVTMYFSETVEVEANSENEATDKAYLQLKNSPVVPIVDEYEVVCLEG